jgi:hypothetical protein
MPVHGPSTFDRSVFMAGPISLRILEDDWIQSDLASGLFHRG